MHITPNKTICTHCCPQKNKAMNVIDSCWRSNPKWASKRQALADCAKGFGSGALGAKNGTIYIRRH